MASPRFPAGYQNVPVRAALDALASEPSMDGLDALLKASVRGGLAVDVTGSTPETGTRIRTIVSTDGEPVLPLFTSIDEVKLAVASALDAAASAGERDQVAVQAAILPARDALALIGSDEFVAVQFDPGSTAQVIMRTHIETALKAAERTGTE